MGIIYEIVCNETGERYIGSTIQTLKERIKNHKTDVKRECCSSKQIIERGNFNANVLEYVNGDNLRIKEQEWINKLENINTLNSYNTEEHKIKMMRIYRIDYNNRNKETLRTKINCECGGHYILCLKSRHLKTKRHLNSNGLLQANPV